MNSPKISFLNDINEEKTRKKLSNSLHSTLQLPILSGDRFEKHSPIKNKKKERTQKKKGRNEIIM
jgi:hypothetical protein